MTESNHSIQPQHLNPSQNQVNTSVQEDNFFQKVQPSTQNLNLQNHNHHNIKQVNSCNEFPHQKHPQCEMDNLQKILENNVEWAKQTMIKSPHLFEHLAQGQHPEYLWIGCSDSRVPANQVVGLKPGELFVHRNIANQAPLSDINAMAVIQFAVDNLKVKDIIVCGHYCCGGIRAAFRKEDYGALETWLSYIRNLKLRFRNQLKSQNQAENEALLVQLNVRENVQNVARTAVVQKAWKQGRKLRIHGLVYRLQNGILNNLDITMDSINDLPEQSRLY